MGYTTYDFSESLDRAGLDLNDVESVIAAWGQKDDPDGYCEWEGGFLLRLKDATLAYVTGWCDTTGWGCQDGASIYRFSGEIPSRLNLPGPYEDSEIPDDTQWDEEPADLNRYVQGLISKHDAPV